MKKYILIGYLFLLGLSYLVRSQQNDLPVIKAGQQESTIITQDGEKIVVRYYDLGKKEQPTIFFIHGSPVASSALFELAQQFPEHRVILPDLPGFGTSTQQVSNYSIHQHARQCWQLLEKLQIQEVSLVGYSMGSGVAIEMINQQPRAVNGFVSLAGIGLQEYELLGDYNLNNFLHRLQWLIIRGAELFVPHFGYFDGAIFDSGYARNFLDSDQRPLQQYLAQMTLPTLFIHGKKDRLVPFRAATAHHQLVPQSELISLESEGHLFPITAPSLTNKYIKEFLTRIQQGDAITRQQASPDRIEQANNLIIDRPLENLKWTSVVIVLFVLIGATFISEDLTCIMSGILVTQANLSFWIATTGCLLGIFVSDLALYVVGRWLGEPALRKAPLRWMLSEDAVARSRTWFSEKGGLIILITRFIPGTRLPTYFSMGALQIPLKKFLPFFALSAILWTPALVYISGQIGESLFTLFHRYEGGAIWALLALLGCFFLFKKILLPLCTWKGRKLLQARWIRLTRWEFWPIWIFYPIPVLYILWQGIKYRSLTLFTACNPAFPESGFVEESKSDILNSFDQTAQANIPAYEVISQHIPVDLKIEQLDRFLVTHQLSYPIVLKPDVGQRGQGVKIAHQREEALAYLRTNDCPIIVQQFVSGVEFGIFYARLPNQDTGNIISITDKQYLYVEGNGHDNIETLILKNTTTLPRYSALAKEMGSRILAVPPLGKQIKVAAYGTHARGAVFLDANHLLTPELTKEIDRLSKACPGFYFGRYDIKVPHISDLQSGQNISLIELNGITSESTHMYDPQYSLFSAYRILCKQWKLAFQIGDQNAKRGKPVTSLFSLLQKISQYLN